MHNHHAPWGLPDTIGLVLILVFLGVLIGLTEPLGKYRAIKNKCKKASIESGMPTYEIYDSKCYAKNSVGVIYLYDIKLD